MDSIIRKLLFVVVSLLVISGFVFYTNKPELFKKEDIRSTDKSQVVENAVKVLVKDTSITTNNRVFEAVGTGRARQSVDIYPSVAEEVKKVLFLAQDRVPRGALLVQLDDEHEKLEVTLAEVRLREKKSLLGRYEQAVKEGAVPQSEVDTARAEMESAQVTLEQARLAVRDRKVIAPFAGFVGIPSVEPGDKVTTSTKITGLDDRTVIFVDFEIPEALVGSLSEDQKIVATTPAYPDRQFEGLITALESRVDSERRTIKTRASIDNKSDLLRPGMSFSTKWEIKGDKFPTIPEIALQWSNDGSYVWVVRSGKANRVPTRVVARRSGMILVEADIAEGEPVVVEGFERLDQGTEVIQLGNSDSSTVIEESS